MTGDPILTLSEARDPLSDAVIRRGLAAYNTARFRPSDNATLDVLVRDDSSGEVLGGLLGHTSYRLFFLDVFHLPEELRGAGLGNRIIALAEAEARGRGCTAAFVYTVTFQAPGFYERHGYRRFGEIVCPPDGATRVFLSKTLAQARAADHARDASVDLQTAHQAATGEGRKRPPATLAR